jgi:hypothetical protein
MHDGEHNEPCSTSGRRLTAMSGAVPPVGVFGTALPLAAHLGLLSRPPGGVPSPQVCAPPTTERDSTGPEISLEVLSALLGSLQSTGAPGPPLDFGPVPHEGRADLGHGFRERLVVGPVGVDVLRMLEAEALGDVSRSDELVDIQPPPHARAP